MYLQFSAFTILPFALHFLTKPNHPHSPNTVCHFLLHICSHVVSSGRNTHITLCLPPKFYHFFSLMLKYEFLQHALSFSTPTKATISRGTFLIQFCAAVTDIHLTVS